MRTAKDFAEDLKIQLKKIRDSRENATNSQINGFHHHFRKLTRQFDAPGPNMQSLTNFEIPDERFPIPVRLF